MDAGIKTCAANKNKERYDSEREKNIMQVKIIDGKYKGQILEGHRVYYDHLHTGSSPDLFVIKTANREVTIASDCIDIPHYEKQLLQEELARLGANVGDVVQIIRYGSGYYKRDWDETLPHRITEITPIGYVVFDDGLAEMFRPDVIVL